MERRGTRRRGAVALAIAGVAALAACGGGESTGEASGGDASPTTTLTGEPVKVGFLNPNGGSNPNPGVEIGAMAGQRYVNEELGGIGGRPLEILDCDTDGTPESVQSCANTFVSEKVVLVLDGYSYSSSTALPTLKDAGIPLVGMIAFDSVTGSAAENRVYFAAPQASFLIGALQAFKEDGKNSVTLALVDTPAAHQTVDGLLPVLAKALGMKAKGIYFSPTNPNFTAVASTIAEGNPDAGGLIASPSEAVCTSLVQGLRQLSYKGTIFTAACTKYIADAPEQAVGGALYSSNWLPAAKDAAPAEVQEQLTAFEKYVDAEDIGYYSVGEFALVVNVATALSEGKDTDKITSASALETLKGLKDFQSFLGPKVTCGSETSPNCTTQMLLFEVGEGGAIQPVTGDWVSPSPEILAAIPGAS